MKVLIIGAGGQGVGLAGLLAMESDVTRIVLADYAQAALDGARTSLESLGERHAGAEVEYHRVDASDTEAVAALAEGASVIANCTIPAFNIPIMKAALQVRAHYFDLFASPWEAEGVPREQTIDAQFDLDAEFKEAGVLALPSIGISPGWSSLAAQKAIDALDTVDDVIIRFYDYVDTDEMFLSVSPAVILDEWLGAPFPVRIVDGEVQEADLLDSREDFDFLEPIGTRRVYTVTAHPDIVLINRFAGKPIGRLEEKFGIGLGELETSEVVFKALQQVTSKPSDGDSAGVIAEMEKAFIPPSEYAAMVADGRIRRAEATYTVEVAGSKDGVKERHLSYYRVSPETADEKLPGASPAVYATIGGTPITATLALARGEITETGVLSLGQISTGEQMLQGITERGITIHEVIERED